LTSLQFPEILEEKASGELKTVYEEIKQVMRVPIVAFFWRALAVHHDFFIPMWKQLKPNAESQYLETKAAELRTLALLADSNELQNLDRKLRRSGWRSSRIREIKQKVDSYRYITPKMLLLASAVGESLVQGSIGGTSLLSRRIHSRTIIGSDELPMVSLKSLSKEAEKILGQIKVTHQWHGVASAYRTFALYPEFLKIAWNDVVRPVVRSDEYNSKANELYWLSANYALHVPFKLNLGTEWRTSVGIGDVTSAEIKAKVDLFRRFLSDFMIDVQRIKVSLDGIREAKTRELS
jgi:hypothetical protein